LASLVGCKGKRPQTPRPCAILVWGGIHPEGKKKEEKVEAKKKKEKKKKEKEIHRDTERVVSRGTTTYYVELRREALAVEYRLQ